MSLLTKEASALISAGISKHVEKNKGCMSLRDTIAVAASLCANAFKTGLESSESNPTGVRSQEDYKVAVGALQTLLDVFGINVDVETLQDKE